MIIKTLCINIRINNLYPYFIFTLAPVNKSECNSCKQRFRRSIPSPSPSLFPSPSLRTKCFSEFIGKVATIN